MDGSRESSIVRGHITPLLNLQRQHIQPWAAGGRMQAGDECIQYSIGVGRSCNARQMQCAIIKTINYTTYAVGVRGRCNSPRDLPFLAGLGHIRGRDRPKRGDFGGTPRGYPVSPNLPAKADCVRPVKVRNAFSFKRTAQPAMFLRAARAGQAARGWPALSAADS